MGAVQLVLRQDLPESFCAEKCATGGKMMMLSVVLSIGLRLTDDTEISMGPKHTRTNERHDGRGETGKAKGEGIVNTVNLNR